MLNWLCQSWLIISLSKLFWAYLKLFIELVLKLITVIICSTHHRSMGICIINSTKTIVSALISISPSITFGFFHSFAFSSFVGLIIFWILKWSQLWLDLKTCSLSWRKLVLLSVPWRNKILMVECTLNISWW